MGFGAVWRFVRALATAPDTAHWIAKYDAAKRENADLKLAVADEAYEAAAQLCDAEVDAMMQKLAGTMIRREDLGAFHLAERIRALKSKGTP